MSDFNGQAIAIVGLGAILPDAPDVNSFWNNLLEKRYSITEVPPDRWSIQKYYDPDPAAPDKTYCKIGGWVRGFDFNWQHFRIPPKVAAAMDPGQHWAVTATEQALKDYGYPGRPLDTERTAVILGTAMGGELHYLTNLRISFPEYAQALESVAEFSQLPGQVREAILEKWESAVKAALPAVTEDSMPGELPNIVSGRVANVFNLRGPNFITDAACAASLAAVNAAIELLARREVDAVVSGGVDHNMGASTFIKFCKIGALSSTGTRPFGEGADGFVMGEGAATFLLKRLEDAERDGDRVYAVIRGVGGASDGKGKGIYAPNPAGQQLAIRRAWENSGLDPATATLIEAHGTSTKVGDVVEVESLAAVFGRAPAGSIALGSVKSNIGHLKAGAGAAGLLKAALAIHHKILPPTLNAQRPHPGIDFHCMPFYLNHEAQAWEKPNRMPRRCGVSAYGFGGTNFHLVLEEHVPGMLTGNHPSYAGVSVKNPAGKVPQNAKPGAYDGGPRPLRGILAVGADTTEELEQKLDRMIQRLPEGNILKQPPQNLEELRANERLVIDFGGAEELGDKLLKARKVSALNSPQAWNALQAQGIFRGSGPKPGKIAFLFPGQGSQYLNMGRSLIERSPVVAQTFAEADKVMTPVLGKPLSTFIFVESQDPAAVQKAQEDLMQTAITQPAVLTLDIAIFRLLGEYGFHPDLMMGHSLGEYAALVAAGSMPFAEAVEAVAARGREMSSLDVPDKGWMAAVMAPYEVVEKTLEKIDGYVVAANINSYSQCVIGGESKAVEQAIAIFQQEGYQAGRIPVSHAFHTRIVAPASGSLRQVLDRLHISSPQLPVAANVSGDFYPAGVGEIKDILQQQIASPVQWIRGVENLYRAGARAFVEVGPKKALKGFVDDILGNRLDLVSLFTNHPKTGELASFNHAVCGLLAAGYLTEELGANGQGRAYPITSGKPETTEEAGHGLRATPRIEADPANGDQEAGGTAMNTSNEVSMESASHLLAQALRHLASGNGRIGLEEGSPKTYDRNAVPAGSVVISGTGLGLPGAEKAVMDPENARRILRGEQFVDLIPERFRKRILAKQITRVVKSEDGSGRFEVLTEPDEAVRLAGRPGSFDLAEEYGVPEKLVEALDTTTQLAMAAGLDALREAGIPLVQTYRLVSNGNHLPDRWLLPEALRDETGVIFASAFPGGDRFAGELSRYYTWQNRISQLEMLEDLRRYAQEQDTLHEINRRVRELRLDLEAEPYQFDRRFIFRILAMGHSQFAEYIGARGPNTQVNAACASTTHAIALAEDWIRSGRCRRVIVIAADNVTGDTLLEWVGAGLLATGAVATDDRLEDAALPFDRRRHGTLIGMGACALVLESEDTLRERGMRGIVELLSSETCNSAYHGTRLDVDHIAEVMDQLVTAAERRFGVHRISLASQLVFMSHETFTPARGGSASAEVAALRRTFGDAADEIVISNTKGFTGHAMGVGIEDVIAVKILETGIVPPVPNFKEMDPELGLLNFSRGGRYPVQYALHLAAGFGSQIAMTLVQRIPGGPNRVYHPALYRRWLSEASGVDPAETEVVKRVLRVRSDGLPRHAPAPNLWQRGTGPTVRAATARGGAPLSDRPAKMVFAQDPGRREMTPVPAAEQPVEPAASPHTRPVIEETMLPAPATAPKEIPDAAPVVLATPAPPSTDPVAEKVLQIVAEKTGYPVDMLDPELDLEADLGIDTVKQAETFLAIRETFDIPRLENLKLRDYPTLKHAIQFVYEMRPQLAPQAVTAEQVEKVDAGRVGETQTPVGQPEAQHDPVVEKVLQIVAEKTGYPVDMLDPELDLEADLGIDTVKQAETFLAIRETFDIPRLENLKLRDYPTLKHAIQFVYEMRPELKPGREEEASPIAELPVPTEEPVPAGGEEITIPFVEPGEGSGAILRRVPIPTLRPALELCKPTGVSLNQESRVVVALDRGGAGASLVARLEKQGASVLTLQPTLEGEALEAQLKAWLEEGPIQGVYWLPGVDVEPVLEDMDLEDWRELNRQRVKNLYRTMRLLYDEINRRGRFLVAATCLGGLHGYGPEGASAPLGGAVTGFVKAYKREQSEALVKAVDFEPDSAGMETWAAVVSEKLIAETLFDPGALETGYQAGQRYATGLDEQLLPAGGEGIELTPQTVFLVTGAAGSITSAITADLARASGGTFYLLDLAPQPDPENPEIILFRTDKEALKKKLVEVGKAAGKRPTPALIEKQILSLERQEAALRAIEAVQAAKGQAYYHSVDLLDGRSVAAILDEIRERHGRVDVVVHAAGVEISHALPDKEPKEFNLVFDVKVDGFFNLWKAAKGMPVRAVVVFSSVAGRFGNRGQTDYSAANDLLCKLANHLRGRRPETQAIAIDWTAWMGIGMASRGSIPKLMAAAGIDMLPPEVGVPAVRGELTRGGQGEVVIAGKLGILTQELDATGGLDLERWTEKLAGRSSPFLMVQKASTASLAHGIQIETVLDPKVQPFLYDHAIDGVPLLPGVMGCEAFAELAAVLSEAANEAVDAKTPWRVVSVENLQFHSPFKFYRGEPRKLQLSIHARPKARGEITAWTALRSIQQPSKPGLPVRERLHFTAEVKLSHTVIEKVEKLRFPEPVSGWEEVTAKEIYHTFFHGPAYQVLESVQFCQETAVGVLAEGLPANSQPAEAVSVIAPRLVELCFQTAGVWEIRTRGMLALPRQVRSVQVFNQPEGLDGTVLDRGISGPHRLYALVRAVNGGEHFDAQVVDESGMVYLEVVGYQTIPLLERVEMEA